jgi:hypothetical protein
MVVYDPAAAASKRARQDEATTSAAAADSAGEPLDVLDVEPISAIPPQLPPPPPPLAGREAAPCLRRHFLEALGLRADLPVHFIDEKFVTSTDLDPHQNRFRIPGAGVKRRLRAILTPRELDEANLLRDPTPRSRTRRRARQAHPAPPPSEPRNVAAEGEQPPGKKIKKPKRKGKVHGGLRVKLVDLHAGAKELLMSRWSSSKGTIVKGARVPRLHPAVRLQGERRGRGLGVRGAPVPPLRRGPVRRRPPARARRQEGPAATGVLLLLPPPAPNPSIVNS